MSDKPRALRLADRLDWWGDKDDLRGASSELRRQHDEIEQLKAEREKVAQWMIQRSYATGHGDTTEDLLSELEWQVRESEREAILKKADSLGWVSVDDIRARGE